MSYVTQNEAPTDRYGRVSAVSRPLIHAMNQARVQRPVFEALKELLTWATNEKLDELEAFLIQHEARKRGQAENRLAETRDDVLSRLLADSAIDEQEQARRNAANAAANQDAALKAKQEAWKSNDPQAPLDINADLGDGPDDTPAAPVKKVANPAAKSKAKAKDAE